MNVQSLPLVSFPYVISAVQVLNGNGAQSDASSIQVKPIGDRGASGTIPAGAKPEHREDRPVGWPSSVTSRRLLAGRMAY